jgi:hypothetical protein
MSQEAQVPDAPTPAGPKDAPVGLKTHVRAAKVLFAIYGAALVSFWAGVVIVRHDTPLTTTFFWVGGLAYCALILECATIQSLLFAAGLYRYRGWQVIVGAMILNPCFLGWLIPISVLLAARRARCG